MKAQQLKNAILQLAIQGKLVPQDPNDEPTSVLFEKIQAEKEKLIAEGKIKKTKKMSDKRPLDVEDDFPFEIPKNWVWVTLDDLGFYKKGPFGSSLTKSMFVPKGENTIKVYEQKNAIKKDCNIGEYYIKEEYFLNKLTSFEVFPNDVIVSCAGTIGETFVMPGHMEKGIINQALMKMTITNRIDINYFLIYFDFILKNSAKKYSSGSAIKNIPPFEILKSLRVSLPPLNEQKRIVAKIEELLPFINEYDKKEQKLTTLNQQFPDQLKKSILQAAIQGQLVAQDPNDEPASELIKRIQAEKERLISEKKIKKPKVKSEIAVRDGLPYEIINGVERCIADELPFEIPESWCWVRLGDIFEINSGLTFSKADLISKNIDSVRVLRGGNIKDSNINLLDNDLYLSKAKIKNDEYYLREFDILTPSVTSLENVGKFGLYREEGEKASFGGFVFCLRSLTKVSENNIFYILQSGYIISKMKSLTRKSGQAFYNLGKENFKQILIPIPPLNEQKRIVRKIEEVFSHIQSL